MPKHQSKAASSWMYHGYVLQSLFREQVKSVELFTGAGSLARMLCRGWLSSSGTCRAVLSTVVIPCVKISSDRVVSPE
ncbi:hypothetical protein [Scytonema sp. NUACC21]